MKNVSCHLFRRRASQVVTFTLFLILNGVIAYYVQSGWGLFITTIMMGAIELIYLNCHSNTWVPRLGRLPIFVWFLLGLICIVGKTFLSSASVFTTNNELQLVIGWAILAAVVIMIIRWFHWHYHVVPISLRLHAKNMRRFLARAETA